MFSQIIHSNEIGSISFRSAPPTPATQPLAIHAWVFHHRRTTQFLAQNLVKITMNRIAGHYYSSRKQPVDYWHLPTSEFCNQLLQRTGIEWDDIETSKKSATHLELVCPECRINKAAQSTRTCSDYCHTRNDLAQAMTKCRSATLCIKQVTTQPEL